MLVNDIIKIVDEAYDDECVSIVDASDGVDVGDTLATFIALEIKDVCLGVQNRDLALCNCYDAMDKAVRQLEGIKNAINNEIME